MFHCHNLIHEDHEMMAAFNVTSLNDFNYTETTKFTDPMEPRYRAKPIQNGEFVNVNTFGAGEFSLPTIQAKPDFFSNLDAYSQVEEVEVALEAYWGRTTLATSATSATSIAPSGFVTSVISSATVSSVTASSEA
jgi:hypothetical protein